MTPSKRAARSEQRDALVGNAEATCPDAALEVPPGERTERPQADLLRRVEADQQPSPLRIAAGEVHEIAVRRGDHLCRVIKVGRDGGDCATLGGNGLPDDGFDDRLLGVEVVVEGAETDIRLVGDLVDPSVLDALAGKQCARGVEQLPARLLATASVAIGMRTRCASRQTEAVPLLTASLLMYDNFISRLPARSTRSGTILRDRGQADVTWPQN